MLNETRTGLEQFITVGLSEAEEELIGDRPTGRGVLGLLITEPAPLRLDHLEEHPGRYGFPPGHPPMTSFLGVPVRVRNEVYGNLYLTDKEGATSFTDEDEALAEALALAAGIAIENTRLHDRVRVMSVLDDRDRIARDLHDRVIQRVYAVGMSLQGAARLPEREQVVERVSRAIDELDDTITQIRSTIFELGDAALPGGLRQAVLHLSEELEGTLGCRPEVRFEGAVDNAVPQQVGDHVLAVVREGLTNAGKHAGASRYVVTLVVTDRWSSKWRTMAQASSCHSPDQDSAWSTSVSEPRSSTGHSRSIRPGRRSGLVPLWSSVPRTSMAYASVAGHIKSSVGRSPSQARQRQRAGLVTGTRRRGRPRALLSSRRECWP